MRREARIQLAVLLLASCCAASQAFAQTTPSSNPAPCSVTPEPDPCGTTPAPGAGKSTMQKFPFPGSASVAPTPKPTTPSLTGVPDPQDTLTPNATKKFPFPGEAPSPAPADASTGSSSSSSSSSSDAPQFDPAADATPALTDKGSSGATATPGRHILHRINPPATKLQSADERENEDLSVARFYMDSGNLSGAYLRGQDAVKIAPDDPEAHLVLAETAFKLNKRDVAVAEYKAFLKLDPPEKQAKQARKELARLQP